MEYIAIAAVAAIVVWLVYLVQEENQRAKHVSQRLGKLEHQMAELLRERDAARPVPQPASSVMQPVSPPAPRPLPPPLQREVTEPVENPAEPEPVRLFKPPVVSVPSINWEQFMGVKLFAWAGGLALFLGVAFS